MTTSFSTRQYFLGTTVVTTVGTPVGTTVVTTVLQLTRQLALQLTRQLARQLARHRHDIASAGTTVLPSLALGIIASFVFTVTASHSAVNFTNVFRMESF